MFRINEEKNKLDSLKEAMNQEINYSLEHALQKGFSRWLNALPLKQ